MEGLGCGLRTYLMLEGWERHHVHLRSRGGMAGLCVATVGSCRRRAQTVYLQSMLVAARPLILFLVEDAAERLGS